MISNWLIKLLLVQYAIITVVCVYECNWPRVIYWVGAGLIQVGILWGMK